MTSRIHANKSEQKYTHHSATARRWVLLN